LRLRIGLAALAAVALIATDDSWAARNGFRGRSAAAGSSSTRSGFAFSRSPRPLATSPLGTPHHFHHGRAGIFVGAPFLFWSWPYGYYYAPPPYYYGPDYIAREQLPEVYVEKFDGTPTPQTPGEIYCPGKQAYYPDVQDCPNGWQRIIREHDDQAG